MRTAKSNTNYEKHGIYEDYASHNSQQGMIAALVAEGAELLAGIRGWWCGGGLGKGTLGKICQIKLPKQQQVET